MATKRKPPKTPPRIEGYIAQAQMTEAEKKRIRADSTPNIEAERDSQVEELKRIIAGFLDWTRREYVPPERVDLLRRAKAALRRGR